MEGNIINTALGLIPSLLNVATDVFNWAIQNPIYALGITFTLIGFGIGAVRAIKRM